MKYNSEIFSDKIFTTEKIWNIVLRYPFGQKRVRIVITAIYTLSGTNSSGKSDEMWAKHENFPYATFYFFDVGLMKK